MRGFVSPRLTDWPDVEGLSDWPTLLLGNGASINIWSGFSYDRLFDQATLSAPAREVFNEMGTTNFESVLEAVMHAQVVLAAMSKGTSAVDSLYDEVRDSLFEAVRKVHVPHANLPQQTLRTLGDVVDGHRSVFTTNYDLLPYWALMDSPDALVADYFWGTGNTFDANATDVFDRYTALYYLHGAVHLWQSDLTGLTGKWTSQGGSLLSLIGQYQRNLDRRPLFVSEGSSRAKQRTIRRSDYLSFALEALRADEEDTVVFGHSLSAQDAHVVTALRRGGKRQVAIGVRPTTRSRILSIKSHIREQLDGHEVLFYDATTHPLGDSGMAVPGP